MVINFKPVPFLAVALNSSNENQKSETNNIDVSQKLDHEPNLIKVIGQQSDGTLTEIKLQANGRIF